MEKYILEHFAEALETKQIHIYYQPIIRTISGNLCGMEALARWNTPDRGILYPEEFVPVLESIKQVHRLDLYIIEEVCRKMNDAMGKGEVVIPVSINLSQHDFSVKDIFQKVENIVRAYDIARDLINLEITESVAEECTKSVQNEIKKFQNNGYQIFLDDFGTGHSSFDIFTRFSFNQIKIDMEMLKDMNDFSKNILISIVSLAKKLNVHTIAEGVETKEQFEVLKEIGCEKVQGYYLGEPRPFLKSLQYCKEQNRRTEGRGWRNYYDKLTEIDFMTDRPLAITEFDGSTCNYLYANKAFQKVWKKVGMTNMSMVYDAVNSATSPLSRTLDEFRKGLEVGGPSKSIDYMFKGHYMRLKEKILCEYLGYTLSQVEISDLTQESVRDEKKNNDLLLRMIYATYETVARIDFDTGILTPLAIGAQMDKAEIDELKELEVQERKQFIADHLIHKQDRNAYLTWIDRQSLLQRIRENGKGYITDYFRTKLANGEYVWQEHQMLYLFGENSIIYSAKRTGAAHHLVEHFSSEHISAGVHSMDTILWRQLMESKSINLFWKDKERRFLGANQRFLDTYGFEDIREILGKTDEDMHWHIDDAPFQNDELDVINKGNIIVNHAGKCIVKGVSHDILVTKEPLYEDGEIIGLLGYFIIADELIEGNTGEYSFRLTDPVTGLLSTRSMLGITLEYLECWENRQEDFALININIKQYKRELDSYGEKVANALLREVGSVTKKLISTCANGARLYSGHFSICMKCREEGDVERLARELERQIMMIHEVDGFPVTLHPEIKIHYASKTENVRKLLTYMIK